MSRTADNIDFKLLGMEEYFGRLDCSCSRYFGWLQASIWDKGVFIYFFPFLLLDVLCHPNKTLTWAGRDREIPPLELSQTLIYCLHSHAPGQRQGPPGSQHSSVNLILPSKLHKRFTEAPVLSSPAAHWTSLRSSLLSWNGAFNHLVFTGPVHKHRCTAAQIPSTPDVRCNFGGWILYRCRGVGTMGGQCSGEVIRAEKWAISPSAFAHSHFFVTSTVKIVLFNPKVVADSTS